MNIGFDAKRAFHNGTGLGHYSRTLIHSLSEYFPDHQYFLFNPKASDTFTIKGKNIHEIQPGGFLNALFPSYWRSSGIKDDLKRHDIHLYHGLSHELPVGIGETGIRTVVTMHDLIHERYPEQYKSVDRAIYTKKFRHACLVADRVIAISEQTKKDLIEYYHVPVEKIDVCYQSCNPAFAKVVPEPEKKIVQKVFSLPEQFFLYVGSVIERKNLTGICKAMTLLKNEITIPLVVIGDGGKYKQQVKEYIRKNDLEHRVIFLSENKAAQVEPAFRTARMFPAIYQSAVAMIYPSTFEGFGIPVLEALFSKLPVITSNVSSLPEAGGNGAYYVDPLQPEQIAEGMRKIFYDPVFADNLKEKGRIHAAKFEPQITASRVMRVYDEVRNKIKETRLHLASDGQARDK